MTLHYHGTPITPVSALLELAGRCFCVSYAARKQAATCHEIGQSVMLDNGAFSAWRNGFAPDWPGYYRWAEMWLAYRTTWAVIPDVIDGDEGDNDKLLEQWPHGDRGAPVWHLHESTCRLIRLAERFPRVCIGSSGQFATVGNSRWHARMSRAFTALCGSRGPAPPPVWVHMLRGMGVAGAGYPFASVDSTDIAQNHKRGYNAAAKMAQRWDAVQSVPRWNGGPLQIEMLGSSCGD